MSNNSFEKMCLLLYSGNGYIKYMAKSKSVTGDRWIITPDGVHFAYLLPSKKYAERLEILIPHIFSSDWDIVKFDAKHEYFANGEQL